MMMITSRHHRAGCLQAPPVLRGNSEDRRTSLHLTHCMVMMIMYDVDDLVCLVSCGEEETKQKNDSLSCCSPSPPPHLSPPHISFLFCYFFYS